MIPNPKSLALPLAGLILLAACSDTPRTPPPAKPISDDAATDACAMRLHDLCGPMLLYFAAKHRLPLTLQELEPYAFGPTPLLFTCPESGLPYQYASDGLTRDGDPWRLLVFDAKAVHHGMRWGIVGLPESGTHPADLRVVQLTESVYQEYVRSAPADGP